MGVISLIDAENQISALRKEVTDLQKRIDEIEKYIFKINSKGDEWKERHERSKHRGLNLIQFS